MSSARLVEEKILSHSCINNLPTKVWGSSDPPKGQNKLALNTVTQDKP